MDFIRIMGIFCIGAVMSITELPAKEPQVIPLPASYQWGKETCSISDFHTIYSSGKDAFTAELIKNYFEELHNFKLKTTDKLSEKMQRGTIYILSPEELGALKLTSLKSDIEKLPEHESYLLKISPQNIVIASKSAQGCFYGAMTLKQLVRMGTDIREIYIRDYPQMRFRGVSDDISRGQVSTLDDFKRIIRFLSEYKMNTYMPYLEDMVQIKEYPSIGKGRGALSPEEIRELQDYAARYYVDVIPIFQTLGHYENILNQPEFVQYAEFPGAASLNTQSDKSFRFLESLLQNVIPQFRSEYFHIGADESWDVGRGASKDVVARYDLATVHARHYNKVFDLVRKYNKKIIMYGDIVLENPTILNQIPDDVIIMDWHYWATDSYSSAEILARYNQPFIVSPGIHNWRHLYPDQVNAWLNIYYLTLEGFRNGALGSIVSNWGDYGGMNFRMLNYRGYAYSAECSWNPENADAETINHRFNLQFFGTGDPQLDAINDLLTRITRDMDLKKLWRYPFYPPQDNANQILVKAREIEENARTVISISKNIKGKVTFNGEQFFYFSYIANLASWYARRMEYAQWIRTISGKYIDPEERKMYLEKAVKTGESLKKDCGRLADGYAALWRRTNKEDNLRRIGRLFSFQIAYLAEMIDALKENRWSVAAECPSKFISIKDAGESGVKDVFLRTKFLLKKQKKVKAAYLQIMGDTDVQIWVNGEKAGEVYATKSLSLMVEMQRVYYRGVTDLLRKGVNCLAVHAHSYHKNRPASANVYLEIHYTDGSIQSVLSDSYWKASTREFDGWQNIDFDDGYWHQTELVEYPWKVAPPLFHRGLPSRIEF